MPFKLKYRPKEKRVIVEKWIDGKEVIRAEELSRMRKILSVEKEMAVLREAIIAALPEKLPTWYTSVLAGYKQKIKARIMESTNEEEKSVPFSQVLWKKYNFAKIKQYFKSIGLDIPNNITTKSQLKDFVKSQIKNYQKYEENEP